MTRTAASTEPAALANEYAATLSFPLDPFQQRACEALLEGDGVLVCAPTGSGKTVVGEFGLWAALRAGRRAFYTTPLKALSNQKFTDLKAHFGEDKVGLLTGDNQVNGDADVVVMTTEVLRNMLYERSPGIERLSIVVMDEVHYLADRSRGATWEEVLIHLPTSVRIAALSATVSNHAEFAAWLTELRGDITSVVETHRPVPIEHRMLVEHQLVPLLDEDGRGLDPHLARRLRERERRRRAERHSDRPRGPRRGRRGVAPIDRSEVVHQLGEAGMLPAIVFIFSRAGCEKAVQELLRSGVRLTDQQQRQEIDRVADERLAALAPGDHEVLQIPRFRSALRNGIAAHHAGMIPLLKETVESLFARGLVKVVCATETLALGINMPARTVVIERLTKWNGQSHELMTSTEFTQLTGRAGRRGIDTIGYGVVCEPSDVRPEVLAALAMQASSPLVSAFRPSYNMAVNLLRRMDASQAEALLGRSFAQFIADRSVVTIERRLQRVREYADGYREQIRCDCGDVWAWWLTRGSTASEPSSGEHPVEACPRHREHAHVCDQLQESEIEIRRLDKRVRRKSGALARSFREVCSILERFRYLEDGEVTALGERLAGIYSSNDLVIAEAIARGVFDDLSPEELAATCSALVHETRPGTGAPEGPPTRNIDHAIHSLSAIAEELLDLEEDRRLELTGGVDGGLSASVYFWALGDDLDEVLAPTQIAAGDFVRSIKQLDDLLRQLAELGHHDPDLAATARAASSSIRRGVVVAGGVGT